ncbi:MAG: hypothetical protein KAX46_05305 [Chromatiaceae bacterium]|nr:hypothetical protein [Chromatiaceae bacterium]
MRTAWDDDEHEALRGLSMLAQLIYLKVFRRRMDYATGIAGGPGRMISLACIIEEVGFVPDLRSTKPRWVPTRGEVRAAIAELERLRPLGDDPDTLTALLDERGSGLTTGYVKKLVFARTDQSVQNMNNPRTTHEQPYNNRPENRADVIDRKDNARDEQPMNNPMPSGMNNPPPVSGIREEITTTAALEREAKNARGARLSLTLLPVEWQQWAKTARPDLDPDTTWQIFRDHWTAMPGAKGCKADWQATWRNWVRREQQHTPGAARGQHHRTDQLEDINAEWRRRGQQAFDEVVGGLAG